MKKTACDILFLASLCIIILGLGVGIFILPQKDFSQKENRALESLPSASAQNIIDGSYFEKLGEFYRDQIPLRDAFTSLCALSERGIGKIETNGVITTNDGICIALPESINTDKLQKNLDLIAKQNETYLYVPPRSFDVFEDRLPATYPKDEAKSALSLLNGETLENFLELAGIANEEYYYKTDHHWTTKGAYFAYTQICKRLGIEAYPESHFVKEEVSTAFYGTSASKSGLPHLLISADSVTLYRYAGDEDITVENLETNESKKGFYDYGALESTDKYKVFLGGNYSHLSIRGEGEKEKLLLIKDSFANSVIPFLALHFDIEVIDPRYCPTGYVREQIDTNNIEKTLILMGFETLTTNFLN